MRLSKSSFLITGSQTSHLENLLPQHISIATRWDWGTYTLHAIGKTKPSSEALTHAACYEATPLASVVVHIHDKALWEKLKNTVPTTEESASAGTPHLAMAVLRAVEKNIHILQKEKALWIVFGGHQEGLLIVLTGEGWRRWLTAQGMYPSGIASYISN